MNHVRTFRLIVLTILLLAILAATLFVIYDPRGQKLLDDPKQFGENVREWVHHHKAIAPICFIAIYVVIAFLGLPVWWLQILSGYGFGLVYGVTLSQIAATISAACIFKFSHWLGAGWFQSKIESKVEKLKKIDEALGHNGLLVVMGTRLMHFMPFGISNYLFGLTTITVMDVIVGTLFGNIPAAVWIVTIGASPHLLKRGAFIFAIVTLNVLMVLPILLRYLKPQWFKRIGVE